MNAGSRAAIIYEIKHGDFWTVLDELWHAIDWLLPALHWRFCQWAHQPDMEDTNATHTPAQTDLHPR